MGHVARESRVVTFPRDVLYGQDLVRLVWHKHRSRCQARSGPAFGRSFTESIGQVSARAPVTARLRGQVGAAAADRLSACWLGVSAVGCPGYRVVS